MLYSFFISMNIIDHDNICYFLLFCLQLDVDVSWYKWICSIAQSSVQSELWYAYYYHSLIDCLQVLGKIILSFISLYSSLRHFFFLHHLLLSSLNHLFLLIYNNKLFLSSKMLSRNLRAFSRHHRFDLKILYVHFYFYCSKCSIFSLVISFRHFMGPVKIFDWTKTNVTEKHFW